MKIPKKLKYEILKAIFNYYQFTEWKPLLKILVFDSDVFNIREFGVVFDKNYNILYWGFDINEAYWDPYKSPENKHLFNISYIRDFKDNTYIFFDEKGKNLTGNIKFESMDNMEGKIVARTNEGKWYKITLEGPEED